MIINIQKNDDVSNGLIKYLIDTGLNGLIKVTSSGSYYSHSLAANIAIRQIFFTEQKSGAGQYIIFSFKNSSIDLNGYSIKSLNEAEQPSAWRIEVSKE